MRIIINTTIIRGGGGMQVSLSFLNELKNFGNDEYHVFLSEIVGSHLDKVNFPDNFTFYVFDKSPAQFINRIKVVKKLNNLVDTIEPDVVFSVFGPTYWRPNCTHVMGFAIPYIIYDEYSAVRTANFKSKIEFKYKKFELKNNADYYITESEDASLRLRNVLNDKKKKVFTVNNTHGNYFNDKIKESKRFSNAFTLLTIANNTPHKNLKIIPRVIEELKNKSIEVTFVVTIPNDNYKRIFYGYEKSVINIGSIKPEECPEVYTKCDAMFLPTLLEVFSASYPEAMKMRKPILTSNLGFAKSICKDAALYFDPINPKDIATIIKLLVENKKIQEDLILKGSKRLLDFPNSRQRAEKYIEICKKIIKNN
jgi:glycosyltransferase involved in cell wall biosynthesis